VAQKVQVSFVDDLDGSEAEGTVLFGIDGREYEIDLSKKNADKLARAVQPFIDNARKVGSARRRPVAAAARHDQSAVREWARASGMAVSDRGRIPASVMEAYAAGH
jgi:hypothetical protein